MSKQPSKYQKDIFEFVKNGNGNCVINAVAGSGKTTTIIHSLKFIPQNKSVIFLAFNKSIVDDIKAKIPLNITVKTFHSLGNSAIYKTYKNKSILDNNKIYDIINTLSKQWKLLDKKEIDIDYKSKIKRIVDLARLSLYSDDNMLLQLCIKHQIDITDLELNRALKVLEIANNDISRFDFTDMIYWPAKYDHFILDKYDLIFIDECQDLNTTQHKLIEKISHKNSRFIAVGDKNQAIYGFAAADIESFEKLTKKPNTITLPLSVNYRCGSNIVNVAKKYVPQIEAYELSEQGIVNNSASILEIDNNDMVLCRNTAPLLKLCLELIHKNKKAYVKGSDIGEEIIRMIVRSNTTTTDNLIIWLNNEFKKIILNIKKLYPYIDDEKIKSNTSFIIFMEKYQLLNTLISDEKISYTDSLIKKIRQIFLDSSSGICLSTIHKAKGLENDRVFIIDKEKTLPSKFATEKWQIEQEKNLEYVAYTRAKNYLGIITDWSFYEEKN